MIRSRQFFLGFVFGLVLLIAANIYSFYLAYEGGGNGNGSTVTEEIDALKEFGWPFRIHKSGTILQTNEIRWDGLTADALITIGFAVGVGAASFLLINRGRE